ncbi:MAG: peptidylprolyl isomerase [Succinivibrio sp.]
MRLKQSVLQTTFKGLVLAGFICTATHAQEVALDSTAAVVNNGIVLESQLNEQTHKLMNQYAAAGAKVDEITARRQALQSLITRELILQIAQNNGATITDMQLDSTLEGAALRNNSSVEKILRSTYGSDISLAMAREKFKEDYLINEIRKSNVRQRIHISSTEVNTLAKALKSRGSVEPMYHIGQVLIPLSSNPTENEYLRVQAQSRQALNAVRNGVNIEEVAAKYADSDHPADMGYLPETSIPLPFLPAIVNAKPGDVVGPFRSTIGMHIFKVFDVTQSAVSPIKTYNASHILVRTSIIYSDEAAIAKLKDIASKISSGELSFSDAAKMYSEDPGSAVNGGNLGYAPAETYDPGFAKALTELRVGQLSAPVKSSYGWHLILLNDEKIDKDSMEVYEEKAKTIIFEREYAEASVAWERSLREMSYIHVIDPVLVNAGVSLDNNNVRNDTVKTNHDDADSQVYSENSHLLN